MCRARPLEGRSKDDSSDNAESEGRTADRVGTGSADAERVESCVSGTDGDGAVSVRGRSWRGVLGVVGGNDKTVNKKSKYT